MSARSIEGSGGAFAPPPLATGDLVYVTVAATFAHLGPFARPRAARRSASNSPPSWSTATAACCGPMRRRTAAGGCRRPSRDVDPRYLDMLIAYEDKRFRPHLGVDPLAVARAALQLVSNGRIVSGGSTLTMQVARLLEPRTDRTFVRQAAPGGARDPARARASQGRDPHALSRPRALWRQSRRRARRLARLFRQGAEAALARRSRAAGRDPAIARAAPARPLGRRRASRARPRARPRCARRQHSRSTRSRTPRPKPSPGGAPADADARAARRRSGDRGLRTAAR